MPIRLRVGLRNGQLDAVRDAIDGGPAAGTIEIRTGAMPANPEAADSGTLLGTLTFSDPSAPNASSGSATYNAITQDAAADATGTAGHARIKDSTGTVVMDCDITATGGGGTIELNTTSIVAGGPIQITSMTLSSPLP